MYRNDHDAGLVRMTMRGDGIKIADLRAGAADDGDLEQLIRAGCV